MSEVLRVLLVEDNPDDAELIRRALSQGSAPVVMERVEDAGDIAWLKRARRKPLHYRPLEEYLAERTRG